MAGREVRRDDGGVAQKLCVDYCVQDASDTGVRSEIGVEAEGWQLVRVRLGCWPNEERPHGTSKEGRLPVWAEHLRR